MAHHRCELASLLLAGLQAALLVNDWLAVTALKSRLHQLAAYRLPPTAWLDGLCGLGLPGARRQWPSSSRWQLRQPNHLLGPSTSPQVAEVEEEILSYFQYFEALFQGHHVTTAVQL